MSCYRPLQAYRTPAGDVRLGTDFRGDGRWLELACSRCIGCKLDRGRSWALRIMHEAQQYDRNLCLTLTYKPECLPASLSLEYEHIQLFMKRVRRKFEGVTRLADGRRPIRFFVAGEYGAKFERPHWHLILFNVWFPDMVEMQNGYFSSRIVDELWENRDRGVVIDRLDSAAAAYVAGYTLKKARDAVYVDSVVDTRTGELFGRRPPFVVMSRRPGIGAEWYKRFGRDCLPGDFVVADGQKYKVPRFYLERFRKDADPGVFEEVMHGRFLRAEEQRGESTPERRAVREELAERKAAMFNAREL